jgi:hypothetical protein
VRFRPARDGRSESCARLARVQRALKTRMMHALTDQVVALGIKRLRRAHVEHTYPPERSVSVRRLKSSPLKCASAKSCRAARPSRRGRPSGGIR